MKELCILAGVSSLVGLICSIPVSFGIWKIFETFIISGEQMQYRFGMTGMLAGILMTILLMFALSIIGWRFVKKVRCDGNFKDAAENRDGKKK